MTSIYKKISGVVLGGVMLAGAVGPLVPAADAQRRDYNNGYYNGAYRRGVYNDRSDRGYYDRKAHSGIGPGKGAAIGAGGGAVLGALLGGGMKGALIGGAAGAGVGALAGKAAANSRHRKYCDWRERC